MFWTLTLITALIYLASTFLFLGEIAFSGRSQGPWGQRILWLGMGSQLVTFVAVAAEGEVGSLFHLPTALTLAAFLCVGIYLAVSRGARVRQVGTLVAPLAVLLLATVLVSGEELSKGEPLGAILPIHITLAFLGTAAFSLAFLVSALHLLQVRQLKRKRFGLLFRSLPSLDELDSVNFRCVAIGFPIYTVAILLGFFWAARAEIDQIYGVYALAMGSWLVYGVVLQMRVTAGWRGTKAAIATMVGFAAAAGVVIVYLVN